MSPFEHLAPWGLKFFFCNGLIYKLNNMPEKRIFCDAFKILEWQYYLEYVSKDYLFYLIDNEVPAWKSLFDIINEEENEKLMMMPATNAFEEMIQWTKEGKLWKFPIDNEQGQHFMTFTEHISLLTIPDHTIRSMRSLSSKCLWPWLFVHASIIVTCY